MSKGSESVKQWRANLKIRSIRLFGEACCVCGYNTCVKALEFHHLSPEHKDFSISSAVRNPKSWTTVVEELRKCILVCANCHREIHEGLVSESILRKSYFLEEFVDYKLVEQKYHFCVCGVKIPENKNFCSLSCYRRKRHIVDWDAEKENIINYKDIDQLPFTKIAEIYETSDKTIAKWYYRFKNI